MDIETSKDNLVEFKKKLPNIEVFEIEAINKRIDSLFSQLMNKTDGTPINVDFSQYVYKSEFEKHKKENDKCKREKTNVTGMERKKSMPSVIIFCINRPSSLPLSPIFETRDIHMFANRLQRRQKYHNLNCNKSQRKYNNNIANRLFIIVSTFSSSVYSSVVV